MINKKYRGSDLEKLIADVNFEALKKEFTQQMTRQKQRYAINTMLEEYEMVVSINVKKVRKK